MAIKEVCDRCDKEIDAKSRIQYTRSKSSMLGQMLNSTSSYDPMDFLYSQYMAKKFKGNIFNKRSMSENALCKDCAKQVETTLQYLFKSKPNEWEKILMEIGKKEAVKTMLLEDEKK